MLDLVRNHKHLMLFILLLLVVPSFVLFGIGNYERTQDGSARVAQVDGTPISQTEWDNAQREQVERIRASNPGVDSRALNSAAMKMAALNQLIEARLLTTAAHREHLLVTDRELSRTLMQIPQIAALRQPDGTFDAAGYRRLLLVRGLTPESFEASVRQNLLAQRVVEGALGTSFVTHAATDRALRIFGEGRTVQIARFTPAQFRAQVHLSEADVHKYYAAHPQAFAVPESVDIEYLELDAAHGADKIRVSAADARAYYEQNQARYGAAEERRASHILVAVAAHASAADRAKARARAERLLAAVRKDPSSFAAVARRNSDDPGSAAQGGDLGYFARGAMTQAFENAVFSMKQGQISDLVESPFGFHIIELTGIKPGRVRPFAAVRDEIETQLREQRSREQFERSARDFAATLDETDSLQGAAQKFGLEVRTARGVTRTPAAGASGALASQRFLDALFTNEARTSQRNLEPVQVSGTLVAAARVLHYAPAHTRPFAEVSGQARERASVEQAAALAVAAGKRALADWQKNPAAAQVGPEVTVSRLQPAALPPAVVDAVLRANAGKLPQLVGVELPGEGYVVARVERVAAPPALDEAAREQARGQFAEMWSGAENAAYLAYLKRVYKVRVLARPAAAQDD